MTMFPDNCIAMQMLVVSGLFKFEYLSACHNDVCSFINKVIFLRLVSGVAGMSKLGNLDLNDPIKAQTWLLAFGGLARSKNWKDDEKQLQITDNFMANCGLDALDKTKYIMLPQNVQDTKFKDIEEKLIRYLQPQKKLVIAERTKFFSMKQEEKESIPDYIVKMKKAVRYCEFDELKTSTDPVEEMLRVAIIAGLKDSEMQQKILENANVMGNLPIDDLQEKMLQLEQMNLFVSKGLPVSEIKSENLECNFQRYNRKIIRNCKFCGKDHEVRQCPAYGKACNECGKLNHFSAVCRSRNRSSREKINSIESKNETLLCVSETINNIETQYEILKFNGYSIPMQVDTGSSISVISTKLWEQMGKPKLSKSKRNLEAYDGHVLKSMGEFCADIEGEDTYDCINLTVVHADKPYGLLGRDHIKRTDSPLSSAAINMTNDNVTVDPLPTIKGVKAHIEMKDNAEKIFNARSVPIALEEKVNEELKRLQSMGIITPIEFAENASPVVWVKKPNGSLRMCADYKTHMNSQIKSDSYPIPTAEKIFARFKNANNFAKVDLKSAYWQIEMDDEAKEWSVINTSKGLFQVNRMQMGMKNSSAIFQRTMESILKDLKGVIIYQDDIVVCAENRDSLRKRLEAVKTRLKEKNVTLNEAKYVEFTDRLDFLGFTISSNGIQPDNKLVKKIMDIEKPNNAKEVQKFCGLVNFFGRFIPNFSSIIAPLTKLTRDENNFFWNDSCNDAFQKLKSLISSEPVIKPFDVNKNSVLSTDASKEAIGAVLTQDNHPVIYISRTLSEAERNYSNIEREALAIVWSVARLKHFLMGHRFDIKTDHQPLQYLFDAKKPIPDGTSARLSKWAIELMPYDYTIRYTRGCDMKHADALSRLRFKNSADFNEVESSVAHTVHSVHFEKCVLDEERLKSAILMNSLYKGIKSRIVSGNCSRMSQAEKTFARVSNSLSIENDLIYKNDRLFIPTCLRQEAFDICHVGHSGVRSTIQRMKLSCWWPSMSSDIERMIQCCPKCNELRPKQEKTVNHWPEADPFQRLHIDWGYIKEQKCNLLIIVDAGSGWIKAFPAQD